MKLKINLIILGIFLALLAGGVLLWTNHKSQIQNLQSPGLIPPQFTDKSLFLSPIIQSTTSPTTNIVTGITVPHHLLARDLIANAFKFASSSTPDQILLISPDHFNLGKTDVSISQSDFSTVSGDISEDTASALQLQKLNFISTQNFFYREHGLGAELPFIKYYFPNAKIIVMTFKESTPKNEIDEVVNALKKVLNKNSLVIQSTDFSHYLTPENAELHDEQTLKVFQNETADQLFTLNQPDNTDSIACQYIQTRLQKEFYNSKLQILAHKNSQSYTTEKVESSTSYIVQGYIK